MSELELHTTKTAVETGARFAPVRIGLLCDTHLPDEVVDVLYLKSALLAFEQAIASGHLTRPVELALAVGVGLPYGSAAEPIAALEALHEAGCVAIIGPLASDNGRAMRDRVEELQIPAICQGGTEQWAGEYCFRMGTGGPREEGEMMAAWLADQGHRTAAVLEESSPIAREHLEGFRQSCQERGIRTVAIETISTHPRDILEPLERLRSAEADALVFLGAGYPLGLLGKTLVAMEWAPPRIMSTALEWVYSFPDLLPDLVGWVGVDMVCEENPTYQAFRSAFREHWGFDVPAPNCIPPNIYDMARLIVYGLARADLLTGPGVRLGMERVRFLPAAAGGPRTHLGAGPYDHLVYKGDWLVYRDVVRDSATGEVKTRFAGLA